MIASMDPRIETAGHFALESGRSRAAFSIVRPWRSHIHGRLNPLRGMMAEDATGAMRIDLQGDTAAIEMDSRGCRIDPDRWPQVRLELRTDPTAGEFLTDARGTMSLNGMNMELRALLHRLGEAPAGNGYPVRRVVGVTGSIPRRAWPAQLNNATRRVARAQIRSLHIDLYLEWVRRNEQQGR